MTKALGKRLTKAEKFYVEQNPEGLTPAELAKDMHKTVTCIKNYLKKVNDVPESHVQEPMQKEETRVRKLLGRHKRSGKYVATVMTEAASEAADDARQNGQLNSRLTKAVHQPFGPNYE